MPLRGTLWRWQCQRSSLAVSEWKKSSFSRARSHLAMISPSPNLEASNHTHTLHHRHLSLPGLCSQHLLHGGDPHSSFPFAKALSNCCTKAKLHSTAPSGAVHSLCTNAQGMAQPAGNPPPHCWACTYFPSHSNSLPPEAHL